MHARRTPNARIHLARVLDAIDLAQAPSGAEEILRPQAAHITSLDAAPALQRAVCFLAADVFADGAHGGVATGFFDVGAGHAGADADEVVEVEVCGVDFCAAQDEGEDVVALGGVGEGDGELFGHAAQDGLVDVLDAVGGAEDAYPLGGGCAGGGAGGKAVPVCHESGGWSVVKVYDRKETRTLP